MEKIWVPASAGMATIRHGDVYIQSGFSSFVDHGTAGIGYQAPVFLDNSYDNPGG
jgi:hypothetical protein